jgi:hypothetical protein
MKRKTLVYSTYKQTKIKKTNDEEKALTSSSINAMEFISNFRRSERSLD